MLQEDPDVPAASAAKTQICVVFRGRTFRAHFFGQISGHFSEQFSILVSGGSSVLRFLHAFQSSIAGFWVLHFHVRTQNFDFASSLSKYPMDRYQQRIVTKMPCPRHERRCQRSNREQQWSGMYAKKGFHKWKQRRILDIFIFVRLFSVQPASFSDQWRDSKTFNGDASLKLQMSVPCGVHNRCWWSRLKFRERPPGLILSWFSGPQCCWCPGFQLV